MCVHLLTNASVLNGPGTFQDNVDMIHSLGRALPVVEWVFIFIPILFHAIIGVIMIRGGLPNTGSYPLVGNVRYTLQRATGMVAFAFIAWHVIHMHGWFGAPFKNVAVFPLPTGGANFDPHRATSSAAEAIQAGLGVQVLYAIGMLACVYHLANGLWTMGITWGVWTSPAAQRRANYVCVAFGLGLAAVGLSSLVSLSTLDVRDVQLYEQARQEHHDAIDERYQQLKDAQQDGTVHTDSVDASGAVASQPPPAE
jgi:succinate dehydrogenase / fumarate reductase cytochrome b subunit